jgi:hypothetical protein
VRWIHARIENGCELRGPAHALVLDVRNALKRWGGWAMLAGIFIACDPHGCSCGCGCGSHPTSTSSSCISCTPIFTPVFAFPDASPARDGSVSSLDAARAMPTDGAPTGDAGCYGVLGAPCTMTCAIGQCSSATAIRTYDPDSGIVQHAALPESICALSPSTGECPCYATFGNLWLGTANDGYTSSGGACLQSCSYDPSGPGSCPPTMSCDAFGQCQVACTTDAVCQLRARDVDGDGVVEWVVDPSTGAHCNLITGRCDRPGRAGARVGDACSDDHDCMANGFCWIDGTLGGGQCGQLGCVTCSAACIGGAFCVPCALGAAVGAACADAGLVDAASAGTDGG